MNIKEVAQEAGVSVATISRVLNGSEKVNPKTRQKVTKIIKKMNYFPNVNAKVLRENRSKVILICVPDITNIIYSLITKGVLEYLKEKGLNKEELTKIGWYKRWGGKAVFILVLALVLGISFSKTKDEIKEPIKL